MSEDYVDPIDYGDAPPSEEVRHSIFQGSGLTWRQWQFLVQAIADVPITWDALRIQAALGRLAEDDYGEVDPDGIRARIEQEEERGEELGVDPSETIRVLRFRLQRVESYLDHLEDLGLGFDADKGTLTWKTGKPGAPPHVVNRLIEVLFEAVPAVPGKGSQPNNRETREAIGRLLSPFFHSSLLDPRRGRTVHQTLRDYLRSR